jgi:Holliday junction resolvase RusA-like endonuclease
MPATTAMKTNKIEDKTPSLFHTSDHNVQAKDEVKPAESIPFGFPGWKSRHKQVIVGNPPAKSNCYIIIKLKTKAEGTVTCPECGGYTLVPQCGECNGTGEVQKEVNEHYSLAKSKQLKEYERNFILQCTRYRNAHINVAFEIELDCHFANKRSDLDNAMKIILDCLQSVEAISNDNLCERIVTNKFVDKNNPRIEFTIHAKEPLKGWVPKTKRVKIVAKQKTKRPFSSSDVGDRMIQTQEPII